MKSKQKQFQHKFYYRDWEELTKKGKALINQREQIEHIKNAGLNPALMYGMGGGGGVSASGAQGQGVTQPTDRSVEMGLKQQGLGLQ